MADRLGFFLVMPKREICKDLEEVTFNLEGLPKDWKACNFGKDENGQVYMIDYGSY